MNDLDLDSDVRFTAQRVAELNRRVQIDPQHKARLREELLRRHQELTTNKTQRKVGMLQPLARLKRLTLVAPPALAAAFVFSMLLWSLQVTGHQSTQTAEAARITAALARTVPTVTGWQLVQSQQQGSATACTWKLHPDQRLYLSTKNRQAYFYSHGMWYRITTDQSGPSCPLQWTFAILASRLSHAQITPGVPIHGRATDKIVYEMHTGGATLVTTAWVNRASGLVLRMSRVKRVGSRTIWQYGASYRYLTPRSIRQ